VVTDVKELHEWQLSHLEGHALFERLAQAEEEADPCWDLVFNSSEEASKVARNEGNKYGAIYRLLPRLHNYTRSFSARRTCTCKCCDYMTRTHARTHTHTHTHTHTQAANSGGSRRQDTESLSSTAREANAGPQSKGPPRIC
jgi:hypothetical protein